MEKLEAFDKYDDYTREIEKLKKEFRYYIALKNCYFKTNNYSKAEEVKKEIKEVKQKISNVQKLRQEVEFEKNKKKEKQAKKEKDKKVEIQLTREEISLLNELIEEDHYFILTHFDTINVPLIEYLQELNQKYQFYLTKENKTIKKIKRSLNILNHLGESDSKNLQKSLEKHQKMKYILNKIKRYINKLIHLEYKKRNKINREERRIVETLFAEKYGVKEYNADFSYKLEELYSTYYQMIFKDQELSYIEKLLEEFPDLYLLKTSKRYFYQDILDRYENSLLNKNYLGTSKKEEKNRKELEYYQSLIMMYLTYAFENDNYDIVNFTVKKIERIIELLDGKDFYLQKSKVILKQLNDLKEMIKLGNMSVRENHNIKEIKGEYIFSIDKEGTKIIEDALSVQKKEGNYYINFYTPDVASFIEDNSSLDKRAFEKFKSDGRRNYSLPREQTYMFRFLQGRKKRAIGYHFVLDSKGELKSIKIEKNIIKLYNSYTFDEFNTLLGSVDENTSCLKEVYQLLEHREEFVHSSNLLQSLILDFGNLLGKYLNTTATPCLYKNLENGTISSIPNPDFYVEFTSPLRSYLSIMNQKILLNGYTNKNIEEQVQEINNSKKAKKK